MPRVTVRELQEEIEELRKELQEIRDIVAGVNTVQLVREVRPQDPISEPLNFDTMSRTLSADYAHYSEGDEFWGSNKYL